MNPEAGAGPRRSECPRDIPQQAELLETCFASALDVSTRQMLRVVSWVAGLGQTAWELSCALGVVNRGEWSHDVVWEEAGRIVGNVTLTRRFPELDVWLISNVAVLPEFRRRGIGRRLTQFAIEQSRGWGAHRLFLQVDEDNLSAIGIYRGLGFREVGRRITWFHPTGILAENLTPKTCVESCRAAPRRPEEWTAEFRLLEEVTPAGLAWNVPLRAERFRPSVWRALDRCVAGVTEHHLLGWCGARLDAALLFTGRYYAWEALLVQRAGTGGQVETPLLQILLDRMTAGRQGTVDTTGDADSDCLTALGFRRRRALVWMQCDLEKA